MRATSFVTEKRPSQAQSPPHQVSTPQEVARLKESFEQTSLIAEQLFEKHLAEKDAEIEALKREVAFMASNDYVYSLTSLIRRAADALEGRPVYDALANMALIAELRKAAE